MSGQTHSLYEFGSFRLDTTRRLLLRDGEPVPLTPKAFSTLLALIERHSQVIDKDDLIQTVWPNAFITEATLTQNIFRLRKALGEEAGDNRFIVTVPGQGYSFVADVRRVEAASADAAPEPSASQEPPPASEAPSSSPPPLPEESPSSPLHWPRPLGLVAALLLLAGAMLVLFRAFTPGTDEARTAEQTAPASSAASPRRSVAVLGFRNLSGRTAQAWLAPALAEMFTVELSVGEKLHTISGEAVARMKMDLDLADVENLSPATLKKIRGNLGCDVVLLGSYLALGDEAGSKIRVDLRLQDTSTGETLAAATRTRTESELFEMVADLGQELRQALGAGAVPREEAVSARASFPSDLEAARLYAEGLERLRTFDALAARDLLSRTVQEEPGFPLAHTALAAAWSSLGYDTRAEQEAAKALELSASLPREDRLLVEGQHAETRKNWSRAVEIYKSLWAFFPDDLEHGLRLARAQTAAGQAKEALGTLATLRKLPAPLADDPRIDLAEAEAATALSDYPRAEAAAARASTKGEALGARLLVARARQIRAQVLRILGRPAEALASIQEASRIFAAAGDRAGIADTLADMASLRKDQGEVPEAIQLDEQALAIHRETGNQRGRFLVLEHLGKTEAQRGNFQKAKNLLRETVTIAREINDRNGQARALATLAALQHAEGDLTAAARTLEETLATFHKLGSLYGEAGARVNLAEILRSLGRISAAQKHAEEALRLSRQTGHNLGAGFALNALARLLIDQGELERARETYRELSGVAEASGQKNLRAEALSGQSLVLRLQGDLKGAREKQALALTLREEIQDRYQVAESRVAMAQILLDQGNPARAEREARWAAAWFRDLRLREWEALARETLARALLAQGQAGPADQAMREALSLMAGSENRWARLTVLTGGGAVAGANGRLGEARQTLATVRNEAKALGLWLHQQNATLTLAEAEIRRGEPQNSRPLLEDLRRETSRKGYKFLATRADELLSQPSQAQPLTSRRRA
ncbi:MAG TPA: tetratricopeptide repeat protein [Thermoanaerobaculia bacterium]